MAISCHNCIHLAGAIIAGEEREHMTPCWNCGDYHLEYVNKYCATCKYRNMTGEENPLPPCSKCGEDYHLWEQNEKETED